MTILELQKELQEMYEKYGDIEVVMEDTDWTGVEKYHYEIFKVKKCKVQWRYRCCFSKSLIMNRQEEIKQAASEYARYDNCYFYNGVDDALDGFVDGAEWADKNVSWDLVVKLWNLATKTTIAQVNKEMAEFKSEKEITEYIKQSLGI